MEKPFILLININQCNIRSVNLYRWWWMILGLWRSLLVLLSWLLLLLLAWCLKLILLWVPVFFINYLLRGWYDDLLLLRRLWIKFWKCWCCRCIGGASISCILNQSCNKIKTILVLTIIKSWVRSTFLFYIKCG